MPCMRLSGGENDLCNWTVLTSVLHWLYWFFCAPSPPFIPSAQVQNSQIYYLHLLADPLIRPVFWKQWPKHRPCWFLSYYDCHRKLECIITLTVWVMESLALPTGPTDNKRGLCKKVLHINWIFSGKVAENIKVWSWPFKGKPERNTQLMKCIVIYWRNLFNVIYVSDAHLTNQTSLHLISKN